VATTLKGKEHPYRSAIVSVERGGVPFVDKVRALQEVGAVAVIIQDNEKSLRGVGTCQGSQRLSCQRMHNWPDGEQFHPGGADAGDIDIPVVCMQCDDGRLLLHRMKRLGKRLAVSIQAKDTGLSSTNSAAARGRMLRWLQRHRTAESQIMAKYQTFAPQFEAVFGMYAKDVQLRGRVVDKMITVATMRRLVYALFPGQLESQTRPTSSGIGCPWGRARCPWRWRTSCPGTHGG
jgi:hypothetical protein